MHSIDSVMDNSPYNLIFLHGWGGNERSLEGIARLFYGRYSCYLLCLPGFGGFPFDQSYDVSDYLRAIDDFIEEKKLRDIVLVGHSFGGKLAIMMKRIHPEYKVIAIAPSIQANPFSIRIYLKIRAYKILKRLSLPIPRFLRGSKDYQNSSAALRETFMKVHHAYMSDEDLSALKDLYLIGFSDDKAVSIRVLRRIAKKNSSFLWMEIPGDHFGFRKHPLEICHAIQCYLIGGSA